MKRYGIQVVVIGLIFGLISCKTTGTAVTGEEKRVCSKDEIVELFTDKTVVFEKWSPTTSIYVYVREDGIAEYESEKLKWTVRDDGMFCIGEKGKTETWGCKKIFIYDDGRLYARGSRDATSGWIEIE
jgi:hypothetical protein